MGCEQANKSKRLLIEQTTMNPLNANETSASPVPPQGPSEKLGRQHSSVDEVIITPDPNYELLQTLTTDPDIQVGRPSMFAQCVQKDLTFDQPRAVVSRIPRLP